MNKVFIDNPIKKKRSKNMAYTSSTGRVYKKKPGPKKGTSTKRSTGSTKLQTKTVYKYKKNPSGFGLGSIKLNEALMMTLGVVLIYQLPNIAIKFFNQTKTVYPVGNERAGQPDKSSFLLYQVIAIVGVYFLADSFKLKQSNKDSLIGGMIAGLVLQFVEQFFFNDKTQFYGYLDQAKLGQNKNMVLPINSRNRRHAIPQVQGYLDQARLGQYPVSRQVSIPFSQQTKMKIA